MLQSLPHLRKELDKIHPSSKSDPQTKIQKYQIKILQLLIREKTTLLQNQELTHQLQLTKSKAKQTQKTLKSLNLTLKEKDQENSHLKSQIEKLTENIENLDIQNKMNQMGRMSEQEKYSELQDQFQSLQKTQIHLENQLQNSLKQINALNTQLQQRVQENDLNFRNFQKKLSDTISEKDQNIKKLSHCLQESESELQSSQMQIKLLQEAQFKFQQKIAYLSSQGSSLKQKVIEMESVNSDKQSKINELTKELYLAKLKNKQFEESLHSTQIQQGEQSLEFSKLDKENKRIKRQLSALQDRIKEIEDEKTTLEDKNEQLNRNYKNTKKQLERLKDTLSEANDMETGTKSRIQKLELSIKALKQSLLEKDSELATLKQECKSLQKQLELNKNDAITAKFNLQETKKKYDIVVEARSIAEEKLVLEREEHSKSLSSMIKQKDLAYRQNYKLLQLLQIKDKTIEKVFYGLKNVQELQKQLSLEISPKENTSKRLIEDLLSKEITSHKDRVKVIDEYLQKFKL